MNGTRNQNEAVLARERLHPAIFILPALAAAVTALPTVVVLVMIHAFTALMTTLVGQFTNQPIRFSGGYSYIFLFLPAILFTLPVLAVALVAYLKSTVTLTNQRLTYRTGLISIFSGELPLENVEAIFTEGPLLGRLFGFGTVVVTSVGGLRLPFNYIGAPSHFYHILTRAVNKAKTSQQSIPARAVTA